MASLPLTPITELDAVNAMLTAIGEQPVNTLDVSGISEVSIARDILHQVSRQVQTMGLHSNTEKEYPLMPDVNGNIILPANTLAVDASNPYEDYVQRGGRLYNRTDHTFIFSDAVKVDITLFLAWEELTQVVRDYCTIRAARVFQSKVLGSETLYQFTAKDEQDAYVALIQAEMDVGDHNILDAPDVHLRLRRS